MPENALDWLWYSVVCWPVLLLPAVAAYFCGCINGAILISKYYFKEDVRTKGSGNAGLTNFYRNYGGRYAALVVVLDMLKMVAAVVIACLFMGWTPEAKMWAGLFCVLGHMFPVTYHFKGGKGILSSSALLFLLDWRVALIACGTFFLLTATTRYVSLGSVVCAATVPITMMLFCPGHWVAVALSVIIVALVVWAHRANIQRLMAGNESKFTFHKKS